jgi:acyl CoA:acetate/3-ketoacid CoA transferase beta subunit
VITDLCVFDLERRGPSGEKSLKLIELAPNVRLDEVRAKTRAAFDPGAFQ